MPKELRTEETQIYTCRVCGRAIVYRLPKGLKGEFVHPECDDKILMAEVIDYE